MLKYDGICPYCDAPLHIEDEDLPWQDDYSEEFVCKGCGKKVMVRAFQVIEHELVCPECYEEPALCCCGEPEP